MSRWSSFFSLEAPPPAMEFILSMKPPLSCFFSVPSFLSPPPVRLLTKSMVIAVILESGWECMVGKEEYLSS